MSETELKLKTVIMIVEMDNGVCYQVNLSERQDSAIRSVLSALPEPLKLIDNPLGLIIEHPEPATKEIEPSEDQPINPYSNEAKGGSL